MYTTLRLPKSFFARIVLAIARQRGFFLYARPGDDTLYCDGRYDDLHKAAFLCASLNRYRAEIVEILQERALCLKECNSFVDSVTSGNLVTRNEINSVGTTESR